MYVTAIHYLEGGEREREEEKNRERVRTFFTPPYHLISSLSLSHTPPKKNML